MGDRAIRNLQHWFRLPTAALRTVAAAVWCKSPTVVSAPGVITKTTTRILFWHLAISLASCTGGSLQSKTQGRPTDVFADIVNNYHTNRIKKTMGLTMTQYESWLGEDQERLKKHMAVISLLVQRLVAKKSSTAHIDWTTCEEQALEISHSHETVVKRAGYSHIEWQYYETHHGNLYTNGRLQDGHVEYYQDGVRGVLIPDAPITRIEFNEKQQAKLTTRVATKDDSCGEAALAAQQRAAANSFFGFGAGTQSKCLDDLLDAGFGDGAVAAPSDPPRPALPPPPQASPSAASTSHPTSLYGQSAGLLGQQALAHGLPSSSQAARRSLLPAPPVQHLAGGGVNRDVASPGKLVTAQPLAAGCGLDAAGGGGAAGRARGAVARGRGGGAGSGGAGGGTGGGGAGQTPEKRPRGADPLDGKPSQKGARGRPKKDWATAVDVVNCKFAEAKSDDALWWGSESKTQLKSLKNDVADIQKKIKTAADLDESQTLTQARKRLDAIAQVVEAIHDHGLDSEEFATIFDLQVTQLNLEPKQDVSWPPHVSWARHKLDITSVEDDDRWFSRASSSELRSHGIADVGSEQERLVSSRLAAMVKLPDSDAVLTALQGFFTTDRDVDFEEPVESIYTALSCICHIDKSIDLDELTGILGDAIKIIEECFPNKDSGKGGSPIGVVFKSFPRCQKVLDDAKLQLHRATATSSRLDRFDEATHAIAAINAIAKNSILDISLEAERDLAMNFKLISDIIFHPEPHILKDFLPDLGTEYFSSVLQCFSGLLADCWQLCLTPILTPLTDSFQLKAWMNGSSSAAVKRLIGLTRTVVIENGSICDVLVGLKACQSCCLIAESLSMIAEFLFSEIKSEDVLQATKVLQCAVRTYFGATSTSSWGSQELAAFSKSPLMATDGELCAKIRCVIDENGRAVLEPLRLCLQGLLGEWQWTTATESMSDDLLKKFAAADSLPASVVSVGMRWATDTCDEEIKAQISWLSEVVSTVRALAIAELERRTCFPGNTMSKLSVHKITKDRIALLHSVRSRAHALTLFSSDVFANCASLHFTLLHGIVDFKVNELLLHDATRLCTHFGGAWEIDVNHVASVIDKCCPAWQTVRERILDHEDVIQSLLGNPDYHNLAPLCTELKEYTKLGKLLHSDGKGMLMSANCLKHGQQTVDSGIETVTMTFVLHSLLVVFPKEALNLPLARQRVKDLRAEIAPTCMELPQQIETRIEEWSQGLLLEQGPASSAKSPTIEQTPAASAGPPPAAAGPRQPAVPPPAAGAAPTVPPAAAGAGTSLRDRMQASKRRKVASAVVVD